MVLRVSGCLARSALGLGFGGDYFVLARSCGAGGGQERAARPATAPATLAASVAGSGRGRGLGGQFGRPHGELAGRPVRIEEWQADASCYLAEFPLQAGLVFSSWCVPLDRVGGKECSPDTSAIKLRHHRRLRLLQRGADPAAQLFQSDGFLQKIYVEIYDLVVDKSFSGVAGDEQYSALRTAAILRSSEPGCQRLTLG
jgi:hypothetical protein